VRIGLTVFLTDRTIDPVTLAREAEARGFASLYFPEHTHIPLSRETAPPTGDDELNDEYKRTLDPLIAIGAAAAVTKSLVLGTGVSLVAQHDPISSSRPSKQSSSCASLRAHSAARIIIATEPMAQPSLIPCDRRRLEVSARRDEGRNFRSVHHMPLP
jgi:hypothetical protein